jgi:hypothetical protein
VGWQELLSGFLRYCHFYMGHPHVSGKPVAHHKPIPNSPLAGRSTEPRGSADAPFVVQVLPTPKTAKEADQEAQDRREKSSTDWWLMIFTGAVAFFTFFLVVATILLYRAGERQMALAYPPKILVKDVTIRPKDGSSDNSVVFIPGAKFIIRAYIVNHGRETVTIHEDRCMAYWRTPPLPMEPPWMLITDWPRLKAFPGFDTDVIKMERGIARWEFETTVPSDFTDSMNLYITGMVVYIDRLDIYRPTLFCRRFDASQHRFVPEDNPDYEGHE